MTAPTPVTTTNALPTATPPPFILAPEDPSLTAPPAPGVIHATDTSDAHPPPVIVTPTDALPNAQPAPGVIHEPVIPGANPQPGIVAAPPRAVDPAAPTHAER